jgi:hypothetical protein
MKHWMRVAGFGVGAPARVTPQDAGRESPVVIRVRRR